MRRRGPLRLDGSSARVAAAHRRDRSRARSSPHRPAPPLRHHNGQRRRAQSLETTCPSRQELARITSNASSPTTTRTSDGADEAVSIAPPSTRKRCYPGPGLDPPLSGRGLDSIIHPQSAFANHATTRAADLHGSTGPRTTISSAERRVRSPPGPAVDMSPAHSGHTLPVVHPGSRIAAHVHGGVVASPDLTCSGAARPPPAPPGAPSPMSSERGLASALAVRS